MFKNSAKKKTTAEDTTRVNPPVPGMPLFFSKPSVLDAGRHANAGIRMNIPPAFAGQTNSIPLMIGEFMEAAKYYPVVFSGNDPLTPIAVVGLEQNNYFIEKDGMWKTGSYIPAYVRKYPFVFMEVPDSDQLTLCVDEDAPQFIMDAKGDDVRIFDNEAPTEFTRNALNFCSAIHQEHLMTREFCEMLHTLDLLAPNRSDAKLVTGRTIALGGFQVIDQEKFRQLPDDTVLELHKRGWLPLIYYSFLSMSNWGRLVDLAVLREPKN